MSYYVNSVTQKQIWRRCYTADSNNENVQREKIGAAIVYN